MKKRNFTYIRPALYCGGFLLCFSAGFAPAKVPAAQEEKTETEFLTEQADSETDLLTEEAGSETDLLTEEANIFSMELRKELLRLRIRYGEDFTFARTLPEAPGSSDTEPADGLRPSVLLPVSACRLLPGCPLPTQAKNIETLEQRLTILTESYSGNWSVYVKNLTTDESFVIQDVPMKSASVMKLFILGTVYDALENQELERTSEITDLMTNMICNSSNEASNRLLAILGDGSYADGIAKVNSYISRNGYSSSTHEYNGFDNSATVCDPNHFNQVSARDCGELLERIYHRELSSRRVCNEIEALMLNQHTRYKIPAGLPEGIEVGNKTGEMDTVENDVAVVYGTYSDYILCVLSNDWNSKDGAISHIQEISSIVYNFFDDASYYQDTAADSFSQLLQLYMEEQTAAETADDTITEYVIVPDEEADGSQYVLLPGDEASAPDTLLTDDAAADGSSDPFLTDDAAADDSLSILIRDAETGARYRIFLGNTAVEEEMEETELSLDGEASLEMDQAFPLLENPQ